MRGGEGSSAPRSDSLRRERKHTRLRFSIQRVAASLIQRDQLICVDSLERVVITTDSMTNTVIVLVTVELRALLRFMTQRRDTVRGQPEEPIDRSHEGTD